MKGNAMINNDLKRFNCAGYDALASAIVQQACFDYVDATVRIEYLKTAEALQRYKKYKTIKNLTQAKSRIERDIEEAQFQIDEIEGFLKSQWYTELCSYNPEYIKKLLDEKVSERERNKRANAKIKNMMIQKGITQKELAKILGLSEYKTYTILKHELPNKEKKKIMELLKTV